MTIPHKMPTVAALSPGVALSSLFSNQSGFHNVQNALGTPAAVSYLTRPGVRARLLHESVWCSATELRQPPRPARSTATRYRRELLPLCRSALSFAR